MCEDEDEDKDDDEEDDDVRNDADTNADTVVTKTSFRTMSVAVDCISLYCCYSFSILRLRGSREKYMSTRL